MKRLLSLALVVALATTASHAVEIVNWGCSSNINTGYKVLPVGSGATALDLSTNSNPNINAGYYSNPAGHSPVFYGTCSDSVQADQSGVLQMPNNVSDNQGIVYDPIKFNLDAGSHTGHESYGLAVWAKTNAVGYGFLNGFDSVPANLVSLQAVYKVNSGPDSNTNRFVIRLGGDFYISEQLPVLSSSSQYTTQTYNVADLDWYAYDPLTDMRPVGSLASLSDFNNVTAVGFYFQRWNALRYSNCELGGFSADAIPEPGLLGMLTAAGLALIGMRRR
jgi:hypothetical protein